MTKILCLDTQGLALDWLMRCKDAGHICKWSFLKTPKTENIGKGIIDRVDDYRPWLRWADIIVMTDNTKYVREMEQFHKSFGTPVIGATEASASWELNRIIGQEVFENAGIKVPEFTEFTDYDAAIAYVKKEGRRFVSKPCGDEPDKSLSYCAKSPADLVYMLQRWKKLGKLKGKFMLQEFVPGVEMAVGGWFGPGGFNEGWCENWEEKNLMAGGTGPNCGETGTTLRYVKKSKLADKVLRPCEDALEASGHCGYVDVNCIIAEDGTPCPLEWTMRFGWPTFQIQTALHQGDPVEWLVCLSEGRDALPLRKPLGLLALGVVMAIPDFPYSLKTRKEVTGVPLYGATPSLMEHIHPCEMMQATAPQDISGKVVDLPSLVTAGDYVLVTTGTGETVREARKAAYRVIHRLKMPSSPFWRPDIGVRLKKQLPILQAQGYASGMVY